MENNEKVEVNLKDGRKAWVNYEDWKFFQLFTGRITQEKYTDDIIKDQACLPCSKCGKNKPVGYMCIDPITETCTLYNNYEK